MLFRLLSSTKDHTYISMMFPVAMCDLRNFVFFHGGLPNDLVSFIIVSIYAAIRHLHLQNVAHRDVKDANILLLSDGTPVLVCILF